MFHHWVMTMLKCIENKIFRRVTAVILVFYCKKSCQFSKIETFKFGLQGFFPAGMYLQRHEFITFAGLS